MYDDRRLSTRTPIQGLVATREEPSQTVLDFLWAPMRFFDEAYQVPEASGSGYRWALDTPHTCTHIAFCV